MSRYRLESRSGYDEYDVTVGWDRPMRTFFAEVCRRDSDTLLIDLGDAIDRVLDPGVVLDAVRAYAAIPPGLDNDLIRDALADFAA